MFRPCKQGSLISPIYLFAAFSKLTTQNCGPIKTVWELMDDSLAEQPSSKAPSTISTINKLSSSLSIKGIKFRYGPALPDVIKGVNIGLSPGTYAVICGESGSGKSTVLSLLCASRLLTKVQSNGTERIFSAHHWKACK